MSVPWRRRHCVRLDSLLCILPLGHKLQLSWPLTAHYTHVTMYIPSKGRDFSHRFLSLSFCFGRSQDKNRCYSLSNSSLPHRVALVRLDGWVPTFGSTRIPPCPMNARAKLKSLDIFKDENAPKVLERSRYPACQLVTPLPSLAVLQRIPNKEAEDNQIL